MHKHVLDFQKKWAIIYSPKPTHKTQKRWVAIRRYLNAIHQPFDFVQSEGEGCVRRLAAMFANDGYTTIIIVGGDAALGEAVDGIMSTPLKADQRPALGIIPNGYTNDFANYWEFDADNIEDSIQRLRLGRCRKVDVGRLVTHAKDEVPQYFLNCINIGIGASIAHHHQHRSRWWALQWIKNLHSALKIVFSRREFPLSLHLNFQTFEHPYTTICIGSASGFGQTPSAVPYNGQLDITAVSQAPFTRTLNGLWLLFTGRFLTYPNAHCHRTRKLEISDPYSAPISIDGRRYSTTAQNYTIDIIPEAINFIV
jgi:diacylglycerol kinase family enzyme